MLRNTTNTNPNDIQGNKHAAAEQNPGIGWICSFSHPPTHPLTFAIEDRLRPSSIGPHT